jgi:mediator of replication checkpoint protein 1
VAEEAQESDDDEMLGFGHGRDDGEEEDGEDMDRTLETLVDDKEMDERTVAANRVFEKYQFVFLLLT